MTQISLAGQTIRLLHHRAAFWVEKNTLIVADIHLGKVATLQNYGMAVPEGSMQSDLATLKALILETGAQKCIIVGDLIHAETGLSLFVQEQMSKWLQEVPCEIVVILGNHDRALKKTLPNGWNFTLYQEEYIEAPFCFSHFPKKAEGYFVWSGHIHPQYQVKCTFDKLTLRCFHISENQAILPAFSEFVGGAYVKKTLGSSIYVIADTKVVLV